MIYSNRLQEWQSLIGKLIDIELNQNRTKREDAEKELVDLRSDFVLLYEGENHGRLSMTEYFAFMIALETNLSFQIKQQIAELQRSRGANSELVDYGVVLTLASLILTPEEIDAGQLLLEDSFLNRYILFPVREQSLCIQPLTGFMLRPDLCACALGARYPLGEADFACEFYEEDFAGIPVRNEEALEELLGLFVSMAGLESDGVLYVSGEPGSGRTFAVRSVMAARQTSLLVVDGNLLLSVDEEKKQEMIHRIIGKSVFEDAVLYLRFDFDKGKDYDQALAVVARVLNRIHQVVVSSDSRFMELLMKNHLVHAFHWPTPDKIAQREFFELFAKENMITFAEDVDLHQLVSLFDLPPDKIKKALLCARSQSHMQEDAPGFLVYFDTLKGEIRKLCSAQFSEFATKLENGATWQDIILSQTTKDKLTEACNRIKYKSIVNEKYGFGQKLPYGRGVVIALYGPPGTGKTMAANVLANDLGMDIYRIDLSQISSKYIGESEKNLGAVFEAAKYSNAILFFDEADALFAKRTDVGSSNDKHANNETAFLLQKMEEYSGVCILATNIIQNFDAAFKRRITYMIPIEKMSVEMRLNMWKQIFPEGTPIGADVNYEIYARLDEIAGSGIKAAALSAAYKAAARGDAVTHLDICEALDEEYKKLGHTSILPSLITGNI